FICSRFRLHGDQGALGTALFGSVTTLDYLYLLDCTQRRSVTQLRTVHPVAASGRGPHHEKCRAGASQIESRGTIGAVVYVGEVSSGGELQQCTGAPIQERQRSYDRRGHYLTEFCIFRV